MRAHSHNDAICQARSGSDSQTLELADSITRLFLMLICAKDRHFSTQLYCAPGHIGHRRSACRERGRFFFLAKKGLAYFQAYRHLRSLRPEPEMGNLTAAACPLTIFCWHARHPIRVKCLAWLKQHPRIFVDLHTHVSPSCLLH